MTISINDISNLVILTGNLVADPELKDIDGTSLLTFRIATNEHRKDKSDNWQSKATFHDIQMWGKVAEKASNSILLQKEDRVQVWGKLVSKQKSTGSNGKTYYNTYVKAESFIPVTQ